MLADREALVMAGRIFMDAVHENHATLLPIDSEHNAIFQSLPVNFADGLDAVGVRKLILTASGGPFRTRLLSELAGITPAQACAHPNWVMGPKISVDSATMMNKGLEVIEARWLFDLKREQIDAVIHPQSIIHSMVEFIDHSIIAQLGPTDMKIPIQYALSYPRRIEASIPPATFKWMANMTFEEVNFERFPALKLGFEVAAEGGTLSAAMNAASTTAAINATANSLNVLSKPFISRLTIRRQDHCWRLNFSFPADGLASRSRPCANPISPKMKMARSTLRCSGPFRLWRVSGDTSETRPIK